LEQLSSDAGAKLLWALGVKGSEADLRSASNEFSGHCLALTLLGSYLTDAHYPRSVNGKSWIGVKEVDLVRDAAKSLDAEASPSG